MGAQLLSHYLQSKRIKKEKYTLIYQELVFPFLPEVLIYYETQTDFRKGHDVIKNVNVEELINSIRKKIQFGNIKLLIQYNELIKANYFYDARGDMKEINTLKFFYEYLSDVVLILKRMKKDDNLTKSVELTLKKYGIWILVSGEIGYEDATNLMTYDFLINSNFYEEIPKKSLDSLVAESEDFPSNKRENILSRLVEAFYKENEDMEIEYVNKLNESLLINYKC